MINYVGQGPHQHRLALKPVGRGRVLDGNFLNEICTFLISRVKLLSLEAELEQLEDEQSEGQGIMDTDKVHCIQNIVIVVVLVDIFGGCGFNEVVVVVVGLLDWLSLLS